MERRLTIVFCPATFASGIFIPEGDSGFNNAQLNHCHAKENWLPIYDVASGVPIFANGAATAAFASIVAEGVAAANSEPKLLSPDGEYIKATFSEISAEDAQRAFSALKTDLVSEGVPGAESLHFVNKYARSVEGAMSYADDFEFMSAKTNNFGQALGGSVPGRFTDGVPTLYRQAFSTNLISIRIGIDTWRNASLTGADSARFIGPHELGHKNFSRGGGLGGEIKTNKWAYDRY